MEPSQCAAPVPPLPAGATPLAHQVAGHIHGAGKSKLGMLTSSDGCILKPLQDRNRGEKEKQFYEQVFDDALQDPVLRRLRDFLPAYLGMYAPPDVPHQYLRLDDVTREFAHPCICDMKMGAITSEPGASEEKRVHESAKTPYGNKTGFRLIGGRVYSGHGEEFISYGKDFTNFIVEENLLDTGLRTMFTVDGVLQSDVIAAVVLRLQQLEVWFQEQRHFRFIASSVLIVYEPEAKNVTSRAMPHVQVRMIDFAHVLASTERDDNYIAGLLGLIEWLRKLC